MLLLVPVFAMQAAAALPPVQPRLCLAVGRGLGAWAERNGPSLTPQDRANDTPLAIMVKEARWFAAAMRDKFGSYAPDPIDQGTAAGMTTDTAIAYARACQNGG